jgi:hypothetical protein
MRADDGADQLAGTAIGPIVFARPMLAVIALVRPATPDPGIPPPSLTGPSAGAGPPRPDKYAILACIPRRLAAWLLIDAGSPENVPIPPIDAFTTCMESSTLKPFGAIGRGLRFSSAASASPSCALHPCNVEYKFSNGLLAAWVAAAFYAATPSGLVVCCGEANGVSRAAAADVAA